MKNILVAVLNLFGSAAVLILGKAFPEYWLLHNLFLLLCCCAIIFLANNVTEGNDAKMVSTAEDNVAKRPSVFLVVLSLLSLLTLVLWVLFSIKAGLTHLPTAYDTSLGIIGITGVVVFQVQLAIFGLVTAFEIGKATTR